MMMMGQAAAVGGEHQLPCLRDLLAVLFESFLIISLGYLSCRFKLISTQAKDLNSYLTTFALPMVIFLNIAQMEFHTIRLSFLFSMLIAKLLVFIIVTIITLTISYPINFGYAGSLSILVTQSNDFALGYPLIKSLYMDAKQHEMLNYLSLMAPIQLLILNPLGIVMLEYQKSRMAAKKSSIVKVATPVRCDSPPPPPVAQQQQHQQHRGCISVINMIPSSGASPNQQRQPRWSACPCASSCSRGQPTPKKRPMLDSNFIKALATNPLIVASAVAFIVNLTYGPELPRLVTRVSNTIAASFAAPSLFVVGLSMYGKFQLILRNPGDLLLSSVLVMTKVLILPNFIRTLALLILPRYTTVEEIPYLVDFSFLYGLLPIAPGACIIAKQYCVLPNVVAISMVLSTFMSAPLILAASALINPSTAIKPLEFEHLTTQTIRVASTVTLTLATLSLYTFWKSKKRADAILSEASKNLINTFRVAFRRVNAISKTANPTHIFLFLLAISQTMVGIGGLMSFLVDTSKLKSAHEVLLQHPSSEPFTLERSTHGGFHNEHANNNNVTSLIGSETVAESLPMPPPPLPPLLPMPGELFPLADGGVLGGGPTEVPMQANAPDKGENSHPWIAAAASQPASPVSGLGFKLLCTLQYVTSSCGLIMARFITMCLIVTMAATRFKGHVYASRVTSRLLKACGALFFVAAIWVALFERSSDDQTEHRPVEPSLPGQSSSLYVRLAYNLIILATSIPLFSVIIRMDNKVEAAQQQQDDHLSIEPMDSESVVCGPPFDRRHYLTSSASLSSEASSALTTNTSLESSPSNSSGTFVQQPHQQQLNNFIDTNNNPQSGDSLSIVCGGEDKVFVDALIRRPVSHHHGAEHVGQTSSQPYSHLVFGPSGGSGGGGGGSLESQEPSPPIRRDHYEAEESLPGNTAINAQQVAPNDHHQPTGAARNSSPTKGQIKMSEFNKNSILIVFMLINSILNMTSIAQKLIQAQPYSTFGQVEVTSVVFEFGQGLLTFLAYGITGFT